MALKPVLPGLFIVLALILLPAGPSRAKAVEPDRQTWMQVDETVLPIRDNTTRNANIRGFARKGQVLAVEKTGENWVKVRVNDTLDGWVPIASLSPSGPPVILDPGYVKVILGALLSLGVGVFLFLAASMHFKRRGESRERARQAMADAKRRLQNKVQLLFHIEPKMHSHLVMDEVGLRDCLQSIGYVANLENDPERFLVSCKAFKPNLIVAGFEYQGPVERMVETDAMLINTPVVYLHCGMAPAVPENRIRAYLDGNASEKDLGDAMALCLKRSPREIRYSVKPVALKGGILPGTLMELLDFLGAVKKTGQLLAVSGPANGEILLNKGDITRSNMKGLSGPEAVEAILNLASGSFEFHEKEAGPGDGQPEGALNTQKILMDWAKGKDESNHHTRT